MEQVIGFVGLGKMGSAMTGCILRSGRPVLGWETRPEALQAFEADGGTPAKGLADMGRASVVFSMLWDDEVMQEVAYGSGGLLETLAPGAIHVAMGTISPAFSQQLQEAHLSRGQRYLASPVFGRPEAAAQAMLNIMCSGAREVFDEVQPVLKTMGTPTWIGPKAGQANLMKVTGNNLIFSSIQLLGELYAVLRKAGVAEEHIHSVVVERLFPGPIFSGYSQRIRQRQWTPPAGDMSLASKDNRLCLETAKALGVDLPLINFMQGRIQHVVEIGDGELDVSAFAKRVFEDGGLSDL